MKVDTLLDAEGCSPCQVPEELRCTYVRRHAITRPTGRWLDYMYQIDEHGDARH
jgi:hypothetical protein